MVHSGLQFFYCEQPYFHVGMGSERHNVAYCDFRSNLSYMDLYLIGVWLGMDLRMDTKKAHV